MPKKLMMNNYSKNGMLPITEGLTYWLDSNVEYDEKYIYSHITNLKFQKYNNVYVTNEGIECVGSGTTGASFKTTDIFDTRNGNFCIEIAFYRENLVSTNSIFGQVQGGSRLITSNGELKSVSDIYGIDSQQSFSLLNKKNLITINVSSSNTYIYVNGDFKGSYEFKNGFLNCIAFNTRYLTGSSSDTIDTIYNSIKIYNRALTEEEIQHNYLYEQSIERGE